MYRRSASHTFRVSPGFSRAACPRFISRSAGGRKDGRPAVATRRKCRTALLSVSFLNLFLRQFIYLMGVGRRVCDSFSSRVKRARNDSYLSGEFVFIDWHMYEAHSVMFFLLLVNQTLQHLGNNAEYHKNPSSDGWATPFEAKRALGG